MTTQSNREYLIVNFMTDGFPNGAGEPCSSQRKRACLPPRCVSLSRLVRAVDAPLPSESKGAGVLAEEELLEKSSIAAHVYNVASPLNTSSLGTIFHLLDSQSAYLRQGHYESTHLTGLCEDSVTRCL